MPRIAPTQVSVMNLITDIISEDKAGIVQRVSPNIRFTSVHNGGAPVEKSGIADYLAGIQRIWDCILEFNDSETQYGTFTEAGGMFAFKQICKVQTKDGTQYMQSEGTQTFTFADGVIAAIEVVETDTPLSDEAFASLTTKVNAQSSKIPTAVAAVSSESLYSRCVKTILGMIQSRS